MDLPEPFARLSQKTADVPSSFTREAALTLLESAML
jgi:hypothetical protein